MATIRGYDITQIQTERLAKHHGKPIGTFMAAPTAAESWLEATIFGETFIEIAAQLTAGMQLTDRQLMSFLR